MLFFLAHDGHIYESTVLTLCYSRVCPYWQFLRATGLHAAECHEACSSSKQEAAVTASLHAAATVHPPLLPTVMTAHQENQAEQALQQMADGMGAVNASKLPPPPPPAAAAASPTAPSSLAGAGANAPIQPHTVPDSHSTHSAASVSASNSASANDTASGGGSSSSSSSSSTAGVFVLPVGQCRERLSQLVHSLRTDTQRVKAGCRWVQGNRHARQLLLYACSACPFRRCDC